VQLIGFLVLVPLIVWAIGWSRLTNAAQIWLVIGLILGPVHQFFVWFSWRRELYGPPLFGEERFPLYRALFFVLFIGRILLVPVGLAVTDRGSLPNHPLLIYLVAPVLALLSAYTAYSVVRFFGLTRASGADHFIPAYRELPMETRGIYQYTDNAMYIYAMLGLYALALWFTSRGALGYAAYMQLGVWLHYYCTERPDMRVIYG